MCFGFNIGICSNKQIFAGGNMKLDSYEDYYFGVGKIDNARTGLLFLQINNLEADGLYVGGSYLHIFSRKNV